MRLSEFVASSVSSPVSFAPNSSRAVHHFISQSFTQTSSPKTASAHFDINAFAVNVLDANKLSRTQELSSPSIKYDLPTIVAPPAHQACKSWVIFSDLHVKSASMDVCEQVLDRVHQAAAERGAGVIFLGDFWHVRGSLSVELLNRVLKSLRKWTQPVIMIPGNHDQV